ncbi:hypothetical protein Tco_1456808 [Tanacetum coccineum]
MKVMVVVMAVVPEAVIVGALVVAEWVIVDFHYKSIYLMSFKLDMMTNDADTVTWSWKLRPPSGSGSG